MIKPIHIIRLLLSIIVLSIAVWSSGCGGSSIENPVQESTDNDNAPPLVDGQSLKINVEASKSSVRPGETVKLTATVDPIRGTRIIFNWINATGYGTLPATDQNSVIWTAPQTVNVGDVKVEVIQLVVTAISQVVSVKEAGVDTNTEILTANKTILLTVTN